MSLFRASLFNVGFYGLTFLLCLGGILVRLAAPHRALDLARLWAGASLFMLRAFCGVRVVVTGTEHLPASGPALIASQHQSAFDTIVWMRLVSRPSYIMKQEMMRIPLFGGLLRPAGMIAIARDGHAAALRSLLRESRRVHGEGRQIVIFPEGTRVAPGRHVKLHAGVAAVARGLHLDVIPVATDSGRRWGRRAFRKQAGPIHVAIGPPIQGDLPTATLLARIEAAWRQAEAGFGLPVENSVGEAAAQAPEIMS